MKTALFSLAILGCSAILLGVSDSLAASEAQKNKQIPAQESSCKTDDCNDSDLQKDKAAQVSPERIDRYEELLRELRMLYEKEQPEE